MELALLRASLGDLDGAEQAVRTVLRLEPLQVHALSLLAGLHREKLAEDDRAAFEQRLAQPDLTGEERSRLLFSLAHMLDGQGNYAEAATQLREANALMLTSRRQKGQTFDIEAHGPFIDMLIETFTPAFFEQKRAAGLDTELPIFIFGLPRSGTTLIEQILAAHSQIFGAGELSLARDAFLALSGPAMDARICDIFPRWSPRRFVTWR